MTEKFSRTQLLIGSENLQKLKNSTVMICGLGGVGGYVAEAIIRLGVGKIIFVDSDKTDTSNLNRQILATESSIGISKAITAVERAKSINKDGEFISEIIFLNPDNIPSLLDK